MLVRERLHPLKLENLFEKNLIMSVKASTEYVIPSKPLP
jgi:hypothetical protein